MAKISVLERCIFKLQSFITLRFPNDQKIGLDKTFLISSMGRSGSTFLTDVINFNNQARVMFEPFKSDSVKAASSFVYPCFIDGDDKLENEFKNAEQILTGKVNSTWINKENSSLRPKFRLIKDIRTNLMLSWLKNNFKEIKVIVLVRHPCAVVKSWLKAGFGDGIKARDLLLQNQKFVNSFPKVLISEYKNADSPFERMIFFWCFYYQITFSNFDTNDAHFVFYENLINDKHNEVKNLFDFLELEYNPEQMFRNYSQPSSTANYSGGFTGSFNVDGWKNSCTQKEIQRAMEILKIFNLDKLYDFETALPNANFFASR